MVQVQSCLPQYPSRWGKVAFGSVQGVTTTQDKMVDGITNSMDMSLSKAQEMV